MDIMFEQRGVRFNYRCAGVAVHNDQVLLHRFVGDDYWSLPGGRVEFSELSAGALKREMMEELELEVSVKRLLWAVETFFEFEGTPFHELGFYFLMEFEPESGIYERRESFTGYDGTLKLEFRWYDVNELDGIELKPEFLKQSLRQIPSTTQHIVHRDG